MIAYFNKENRASDTYKHVTREFLHSILMVVLYCPNLKVTNVLVLIDVITCLLMEPQCYDIITEHLMDVFYVFFYFLRTSGYL